MNRIYELVCQGCKLQLTIGINGEPPSDLAIRRGRLVISCPVCDHRHMNYEYLDMDAWQTEANELCRKGRYTQAVKHCRDYTGMDLPDAKEAVQALDGYKEFQQAAQHDQMKRDIQRDMEQLKLAQQQEKLADRVRDIKLELDCDPRDYPDFFGKRVDA